MHKSGKIIIQLSLILMVSIMVLMTILFTNLNLDPNTLLAIAQEYYGYGDYQTDTTSSLTVNKTIFGCNHLLDTLLGNLMVWEEPDNSPQWISCDNPAINNTVFCQSLNENSFEVLNAPNNQQIAEFKGSAVGTTIPNLQSGTYTINEIENPTGNTTDQLGESSNANIGCAESDFPDGGSFLNFAAYGDYRVICFEYEDEKGNNCRTITLSAGESKKCTVKNYIGVGLLLSIP